VKVHPQLADLLAEPVETAKRRDDGEPIEVVVKLAPLGGSVADPPAYTQDVAEAVLRRVSDLMHEEPAGYNIFPILGSIAVSASRRFLAKLLEQPEIASALPNRLRS